MKDVLVYVAGAISKGDLTANISLAHEYSMALFRAGVPCVVPHDSCFWAGRIEWMAPPGTSQGFIPDSLPKGTTYDDWLAMSLVVVSRCDALLRIPGYSPGANMEVAEANRLGKPVFYSVADVITWAETK